VCHFFTNKNKSKIRSALSSVDSPKERILTKLFPSPKVEEVLRDSLQIHRGFSRENNFWKIIIQNAPPISKI
jgi:hypothetical protein